MNKSRTPLTWLSRIILNNTTKTLNHHLKPSQHLHFHSPFPFNPIQTRRFCAPSPSDVSRAIQDMLAEVEREKHQEREAKRKAGIVVDENEEEEEDYMKVGPLIEKLEKQMTKDKSEFKDENTVDFGEDEPSDSETEDDDDDEERAAEMRKKAEQLMERKLKRYDEIMKGFHRADTLDEAYKWMAKLDKFEEKHLNLRLEYRVIGELMNRFKEATGKDKFLLAQKLNRALRLVEQREAFDPNNPANYSIIQREEVGPSVEVMDDADVEMARPQIEGGGQEEEEEFDDMKERDDILLQKLSAIDKKLEEKLEALDHTFGKKGKLLEEEIRELAEERNSLTEKKRIPMYRKGFDVHLIDMNRTCKVTKGGQVIKYTAILACGNYNGVVGFAKAKGPAVPIALQKAYEKCFQNLHYIDRYEDHTIAHAIQTTYKKTKVYLWPAKTTTGMKAGRTVQTILNLAGFKNVKSKVIGSRNPHNTVKALFQALNAIETPKDVQEKFGRTVVESYLL